MHIIFFATFWIKFGLNVIFGIRIFFGWFLLQCIYLILTILKGQSYDFKVFPFYKQAKGNTQQYFIEALQDLMQKGWIESDDSVCYLSGSFGEGFGTTFLEVNRIDKILESRGQYLLPNF